MEHLVLYKMNGGMTDEQEKDMLDHLYSLQYHYRGILAVSLGAFSHPHLFSLNSELSPQHLSHSYELSHYLGLIFR